MTGPVRINRCHGRSTEVKVKAVECGELMEQLQVTLHQANHVSSHQPHIIISPDLLVTMATELTRLACRQPYGVRPCAIHVNIQCADGRLYHVGRVEPDCDLTSYFDVHLTLREDTKLRPAVRNWAARVAQTLGTSDLVREVIYVSNEYSITKKSLRRSD